MAFLAEPSPPDAELVSQACQGSALAFTAIIRRNNRRLYRIARSILKDDAEAEEAVQETYLLAFTNLHRFRGTAKLSTWLARIAVNEALGRLRRQRSAGSDDLPDTERLPSEASTPFWGGSGRASPEAEAARNELKRLLEAAIDRLPPAFRVIFILCAIEHMSIEDAAIALNIPENTVKTRLYRARKMLRESLGSAFASMLEDIFPFAGARCDRVAAAVLCRLGRIDPAERPLALLH
ncbi:MAG TPA: RNA polymerase sigma factor [Acetobacteraceae bacterium]|nr:RNA polymerase sigma factor [Acetobacteraceae bacterium]